METQKVRVEMDCIHNQPAGTMTCEWLGGTVQIVCDWKARTGVVLVRGEVKRRFSLEGLTVEEFMRIEEQTQAAAEQLAAFGQAA